MQRSKLKSVPHYIQSAPKETQKMLRELRAILKSVAPKAKQVQEEGALWMIK